MLTLFFYFLSSCIGLRHYKEYAFTSQKIVRTKAKRKAPLDPYGGRPDIEKVFYLPGEFAGTSDYRLLAPSFDRIFMKLFGKDYFKVRNMDTSVVVISDRRLDPDTIAYHNLREMYDISDSTLRLQWGYLRFIHAVPRFIYNKRKNTLTYTLYISGKF